MVFNCPCFLGCFFLFDCASHYNIAACAASLSNAEMIHFESTVNVQDSKACTQTKYLYTHATNLRLYGMPLAFSAGGPISDRQRVCLGNVTTGGSLEAQCWPAGGCHWRIAGVTIGGPPSRHQRLVSRVGTQQSGVNSRFKLNNFCIRERCATSGHVIVRGAIKQKICAMEDHMSTITQGKQKYYLHKIKAFHLVSKNVMQKMVKWNPFKC